MADFKLNIAIARGSGCGFAGLERLRRFRAGATWTRHACEQFSCDTSASFSAAECFRPLYGNLVQE